MIPSLAHPLRAPRTAKPRIGMPPARVVPALAIWMIVAIVGVAGLAYWDHQRESRAVLIEFADDQAWLADALARVVAERLVSIERNARVEGLQPDAVPLDGVLSSVRSLERPDDLRVLVQAPGRTEVVGTDGRPVRAVAILAGFDRNGRSVTLTRAEASQLGLPRRMAVAGLARVDGGWRLAVVASAQSERDREMRGRGRLLLGVALVAALVILFGGAALRRRTKELELEHALQISSIEGERSEELARADKLATMGALATGIAHEVSTPLAVIAARGESIATNAPDDNARRSGEVIVEQAKRINEVIRGFLDLARGHARPFEQGDPKTLARNAMHLVSHRFAKAGVTLEVRLDAIAPVACDPRLFEHAIVNLLLNACDACTDGGMVELAVRGDAERVAFLVTDDGEGIAEEDASRLMAPFFTTKAEGSGLGLAIASEIVKHHRGSLVLRPRGDSRGTQAIIELPVSRERTADAER